MKYEEQMTRYERKLKEGKQLERQQKRDLTLLEEEAVRNVEEKARLEVSRRSSLCLSLVS